MSVSDGGEGDHAVPGESEGLSQPAEGVNDVLEAVVVPRDQEEAEVEGGGGGARLRQGTPMGLTLRMKARPVCAQRPPPKKD
jgi:hypothetical protein